MQLAIDTMMNSINEPRDDGKESPKVGAVLLKPMEQLKLLIVANYVMVIMPNLLCLRERTVLKKLDGSILFATLEPCAPGARRHPKLGCAERIVNARIKEVWVGIEDPDPDVDRKGIQYLEDNGIKVKMFPPEFQKPIRDANKEFLKQALDRAKDIKSKKEIILSDLEKPLIITKF